MPAAPAQPRATPKRQWILPVSTLQGKAAGAHSSLLGKGIGGLGRQVIGTLEKNVQALRDSSNVELTWWHVLTWSFTSNLKLLGIWLFFCLKVNSKSNFAWKTVLVEKKEKKKKKAQPKTWTETLAIRTVLNQLSVWRKQRKAYFAASAWITPSTAGFLSCSATQRALLQSNCSTVADETRTKIFLCPAFRCNKSVKPHIWAQSPSGYFTEHASGTACAAQASLCL